MSVGLITRLAKMFPSLTNILGTHGSQYVSHIPPGAGGKTMTVADKLNQVVTAQDFDNYSQAVQATLSDTTKFFLHNQQGFTLTVGTNGNCLTLNAAIDAAVRMRPTYQKGRGYCTLQLMAGFIMKEQVLINGGTDLSWIQITSVDPVVTIDPVYVTVALSLADDSIPAFGAINNSTLPVLNAKFQYASNTTAKDGVAVFSGSRVAFGVNGCGVKRSRRGLLVIGMSEAFCYPLGLTQGGDGVGAGGATGVDFSYARLRGIHVAYGSKVSLPRSDFSHCDGDLGLYVIWGSYADVYQSNGSYCTNGTAFHARDGSFVNARESNGSRSKRGFHALHNARLSCRSRLSGATMFWIGDGAQYCTEYGVLASGNSHIEAAELNASFNTGSAAIAASDSSSVSFYDAKATDCTNRALWAQRCSNISAPRSIIDRSKNGIVTEGASTITLQGGSSQGCAETGAQAIEGSTVDVTDANLSGCNRGIQPMDGSLITARRAIIANCRDRAVSAIDGGRANVQDANLTNATLRGITCRNGGHVNAVGANCAGAGSWGVEVLAGSIVAFNGGNLGTSPLSQAGNTITGEGIIFTGVRPA